MTESKASKRREKDLNDENGPIYSQFRSELYCIEDSLARLCKNCQELRHIFLRLKYHVAEMTALL